MITAGVDLSSQTAHTASCVVNWSHGRATVRHLALDVDDGAIIDLVQRVDKLGIDVPLGWPVAFATAVAKHSQDGSWPADYAHSDAVAYRYRRTDLWVWKTMKTSPPLSVSTDRIALPAMRAAALLSRVPGRVMLDGSGVVVEVYPAPALRRWGFTSRGYKRKEKADARRVLVERFFGQTAGWLSVGPAQMDCCFVSDDGFDALVAALVARAAAVGLVAPVPEDDRVQAQKEGWIAVPQPGSLSLLPSSGDRAKPQGEGATAKGGRAMVGDIEDRRRVEPQYILDDRDMLEGWLEFHRTTLLLKCEGLDDAARKRRPVETSLLSLHGLVRHMAEVERGWFRRTLLRDASTPYIYCTDRTDDSDLFPLDDADWGTDLAVWQAECEASRRAAAAHELSDTGLRRGDPVSLRWIYTHMIEEYARHNGHADLIRELVDGAVGW